MPPPPPQSSWATYLPSIRRLYAANPFTSYKSRCSTVVVWNTLTFASRDCPISNPGALTVLWAHEDHTQAPPRLPPTSRSSPALAVHESLVVWLRLVAPARPEVSVALVAQK